MTKLGNVLPINIQGVSGKGNRARVINKKAVLNPTPPPNPDFVSTWKTDNLSTGSSTDTQVKLPLISAGTYNMTVDWGDSSSDVITVWNQAEVTHTYGAIGTYVITISGTCTGWNFANTGDRLKILSVQNWGCLIPSNLGTGVFFGCTNLTLTTVADRLNLTGITNLLNFFNNCTSITSINLLNGWDVSSVTIMSNMFLGATSFNQNINAWDVGNVTSMTRMFQSASSFNYPLNNWDVGNVTSMTFMFLGATSFNQNINSWDVGNVTNMSAMFQSASSFNSPLNNWNVGNVTSMATMFSGATAFDQNIGSWNVSKMGSFLNFMSTKTPSTFSTTNLDAIYNSWSLLTFVNTGLSISFGTAKYTVAGSAGRLILTSAPNSWTIADGGI